MVPAAECGALDDARSYPQVRHLFLLTSITSVVLEFFLRPRPTGRWYIDYYFYKG
jgi:hypothetical protein